MGIIEKNRFLREKKIIDSPRSACLDEITQLVTNTLHCPYSTISIVDINRIWFKSIVGLDVCEIPLEDGLCGKAVNSTAPLVINDTLLDPDANSNSLVVNPPHLRSYLGVPLRIGNVTFGSLTALDVQPRYYSEEQIESMQAYARLVVQYFESEIVMREGHEELQHKNFVYRQFLDALPAIVAFVNTKQKIEFINQKGKDLTNKVFGRSPDPGDDLFHYIRDRSQDKFKHGLLQVLHGNEIEFEHEILGHHYSILITPVKNMSGYIVGCTILAMDISEKYDNLNKLKLKKDILERIAWEQTHELRRPVANIIGLLNLAAKNDKSQRKLADILSKIHDSTHELDKSITSHVNEIEKITGPKKD